MKRELSFVSLGKQRPSLLVSLSMREITVGLGLEIWTDWAGVVIHLGPIRVGLGIDRGSIDASDLLEGALGGPK